MTSPHDADLHADLGLSREASRTEITRAYRDLLRRHHPDTRTHQPHPGPNSAHSSDEALNRAVAAYAVLTDPDRRARYDHQQRNHRTGGEQHTPAEAAGPTPPTTKPAVGPFWPAGGTPAGSSRQDPPLIRVGPVRWHRVSPTTTRRP